MDLMNVKDLKPRAAIDTITLEIVSKGEERAFASAAGQGTVCSAAGKDDAGEEVSVTLWNEQCKQVNDGDTIVITGGWVSEYKGKLQVSTGKKGALEVKK